MENIDNKKTLKSRVWEFLISVTGILGALQLIGAEIKQSLIFAVFGGGIIFILINHIISFFQELDKNIKYLKNILEKGGEKSGEKEIRN